MQVFLVKTHQFSLQSIFVLVYLSHVFPHKLLYVQVFISSTFCLISRTASSSSFFAAAWASWCLAAGSCSRLRFVPNRSSTIFLFYFVQFILLFFGYSRFFLLAENVRFQQSLTLCTICPRSMGGLSLPWNHRTRLRRRFTWNRRSDIVIFMQFSITLKVGLYSLKSWLYYLKFFFYYFWSGL